MQSQELVRRKKEEREREKVIKVIWDKTVGNWKSI